MARSVSTGHPPALTRAALLRAAGAAADCPLAASPAAAIRSAIVSASAPRTFAARTCEPLTCRPYRAVGPRVYGPAPWGLAPTTIVPGPRDGGRTGSRRRAVRPARPLGDRRRAPPSTRPADPRHIPAHLRGGSRLASAIAYGRTPASWSPARAGRQRALLDRLRQRRLVDLLRARSRRVASARPHAGRLHHHRDDLLLHGGDLRRGDRDVPRGGRLARASPAGRSTSSGPSSRPGARCSPTRSRSPSRRSSSRTTSAACSGSRCATAPGDIIFGVGRDRVLGVDQRPSASRSRRA